MVGVRYPSGTPLDQIDREWLHAPTTPTAEDQPSLADLFIARTYTEGLTFHGLAKRNVRDAMIQYRVDMRHARRFVLDDGFVQMATVMASTTAAKTLTRLQFATLPYDTTWLEFSLHTKVRTIRGIHNIDDKNYSSIAPRLGMLLQRINSTDAVCTLVSEMKNERNMMVHFTCYFFSTIETKFYDRLHASFGCRPALLRSRHDDSEVNRSIGADEFGVLAASDSMGRASLWGYATGTLPQGGGPLDQLTTPSFLARHGEVGLSRMYYAIEPSMHRREEGVQLLGRMAMAELREFTGQIRWLVTVLAMLNEVPVNTEHVTRRGHIRLDRLRRQEFGDYHKVTLRLPKKNPVDYYEKYLRGQSNRRHRAHEVRSHWRTYLHATRCKYDEHEWVYDNENGYRLCGRCEAFSRLIREHVRGDESLGWARKDYVLTTSKE